jgi:hypothetical protein
VAEAACAAGGTDVEDDVVRSLRIAAHAGGDIIQLQQVPGPPGDVVVRAGAVAADADGSDQLAFGVVEAEAAAEYVDPADPVADHRIVCLAELRGIAAVGDLGIHGVAEL